MSLTMRTKIFLFLLILIPSLCAEPLSGEEPDQDDGIFFFEEFFIYEGLLFDDEPLMAEETFPTDEDLIEEDFFAEYFDDEDFLNEQTFPEDEYSLDEGTLASDAPTIIIEAPKFEMRSLDAVFPNLSIVQRMIAMSSRGLRNYFTVHEPPVLIPNADLGIDLLSRVLEKNPSHLIEALVLVPYNGKELDFLDIYNALGRIEKIKDYPVLVNNKDFYVFTESTRIQSARDRSAISDPRPAETMPFSETMYIRLKEDTFGNLFIRGDISMNLYGMTYTMTNFADVRYFLVPIMRAERFITIIYLEPVTEGLLIYCMSGFYMPNFIAERVNLNSNINRRIEVFLKWITDGLGIQES